jgi:glycosyltransferase involved in cell wall biosynthesis
MPLISVILSVYNGEKYLAPALESILAQTLHDFEFITIDDGSTDGTPRILEQYSQRDARIKVVTNQPNRGVVASLNLGLQLANSPYIARMDADDLCAPNRFEKQLAFLEQHPEVGLLGTQHTMTDAAGRFLYRTHFPLSPGEIGWTLHFVCCMSHPTIIVRQGIIQQAGGYHAEAIHGEDHDLWIRIARITRIANLTESLYTYRFWPGNVSTTYSQVQETTAIGVVQKASSYLLSSEVSLDAAARLRGLSYIKAGKIGALPKSLSQVHETADLLFKMYHTYLKSVDLSTEEVSFVKRDVAKKLISLALVATRYSRNESFHLLVSAVSLSPSVIGLGIAQGARRSMIIARRTLRA